MDVYDNLMQSLGEEYSLVRQLRSDGQNSVSVWRHNSSGRWYVLRRFEGSCEAYKKLLGVASPHLPQIYEAASSGGLSAVLEEYVCGDTLSCSKRGRCPPMRRALSPGSFAPRCGSCTRAGLSTGT